MSPFLTHVQITITLGFPKRKLLYRIVRDTQLTQYIDKSRFISSLAFRFHLLHVLNLLFPISFLKPILLQALGLHQSISRLRNVTSG